MSALRSSPERPQTHLALCGLGIWVHPHFFIWNASPQGLAQMPLLRRLQSKKERAERTEYLCPPAPPAPKFPCGNHMLYVMVFGGGA